MDQKRKKFMSSTSSSDSEYVDYKKARQLLSFSDSETGDLDETLNDSLDKSVYCEEKTYKMDDLLKKIEEKLEKQRIDIVKDLESTINNALEVMNGRMDDLENENKSLKTQVNHLETQNISLNNVLLQQAKDIEAVKLHAVKNEQYSRKYNLKIYGINESKDESCSEKVCATVKAKLDVNLERKQIATAHRIAGREGKARPLLVRLHKHDTKMEILKKRRILKGTGVTITEDICRGIQDMVVCISKADCVAQVWTWDGKICIKDKSDKLHRYSFGQQIPTCFKSK